MSDRNDSARDLAMLIAGFGLGSLVGTVIGMLIAPKSGRELRADMAEYSKDYFDKVKDASRETYEKGRDQARQAYEAGRERAKEYSSRVGEKLDQVREQLGQSAQRLTEAVRTGAERVSEGPHGDEPAPEEET